MTKNKIINFSISYFRQKERLNVLLNDQRNKQASQPPVSFSSSASDYYSTLKCTMGKGPWKHSSYWDFKKWEGMTVVNWLFPLLSLTPDFPCMLRYFICAVIVRVAFLCFSFVQWNLILLLFPMVEFSAIHPGRNNTKRCVNREMEQSASCSLLYGAQSGRKQRLKNALILSCIIWQHSGESLRILWIKNKFSNTNWC